MKFLTINGKIQTVNGKLITVPDNYNNELIKINGKVIKTSTNLIGGNGESGGGTPDPEPVSTGSATFSDGVTLTWEELKLTENGTNYGYDANHIKNTEIGEDAFSMCESLTSIEIPDGVTSICSYAFDSCTNLESITIPNSVTLIDELAFCMCMSLTSVNYNGTKAQWDDITKYPECEADIGMGRFTLHCTDGDITK